MCQYYSNKLERKVLIKMLGLNTCCDLMCQDYPSQLHFQWPMWKIAILTLPQRIVTCMISWGPLSIQILNLMCSLVTNKLRFETKERSIHDFLPSNQVPSCVVLTGSEQKSRTKLTISWRMASICWWQPSPMADSAINPAWRYFQSASDKHTGLILCYTSLTKMLNYILSSHFFLSLKTK